MAIKNVSQFGTLRMQQILIIVLIMCIVTLGCEERKQSPPTHQSSTTNDTNIPSDVSYSIIDSNIVPGIKRSLDIRLNKRVSESILRAIAMKLKSQDKRDYDRTFITYYLPGMEVGAGAWATTHFNPDLDVVMESTAEEENKLITKKQPANRNIIGVWLDDDPILGSRLTIFRDADKLFIEQLFADDSARIEAIVESKSQIGRIRFDLIEDSNTGSHWIVGVDGNLQIRDNEGLIKTAKRIERGGG